jgi:hydrogenase maturation factor
VPHIVLVLDVIVYVLVHCGYCIAHLGESAAVLF